MCDLLKELYLYIFVLADDLDTTKSLRSVSKTAWSASYDYFKILLRKPIIITFHKLLWFIDSNREEVDRLNLWEPTSWCQNIDHRKYISFQITTKDLFTNLKTTDNIENVKFVTYY